MAAPAAVLQILITANNSQATATLAKTQAQLQGVEASAARSSAALKTFGAAGAIGVGLVGAASVKMAVDFEKAMRNVNSIAQLPEKRFKKLNDQVLALAGKTAQAPKTLAEGLYDLVSSGFKANQSIKILGASAKAATAGLTDTATSTKVVAAVLNAYQLKAKDAKKVSDELFSTVNYGVITFEELAQNIGDTLPFASQIGVKLKEVGAATATMTKQGLGAAETMTRIRNVLQSLIKPNTELNAAFKELNTTGEELIQERGFQGALEKIVATTNGTKSAVAELFPNIRALGGVLALTGANARDAEADLRGMQDASGATSKALSEQSKSVAYQWQKLKAGASALMIQVGQKLLPVLNDVLRWLNKLDLDPAVAAFREFWQSAGILRDVIGKVTAAIKNNLQGLFQFIESAVKLISGVLTGNFGRAWEGVKGIFVAGAKGIVSALQLITAPFRAVIGALANALKKPLDAAWIVVKKIFAKGADFILGVITTIIDGMGKMADAGSKLPGPFGDAFDDIQTGLEHTSNAVNKSREDIRKWAESATTSAKDMRKGVTTNVDGMATAVTMGFLRIGKATNAALEAFGVKKLSLSLGTAVAQGAQGHQKGGIIHAQSGVMVPGSGNGDKVRALLEPGEVVLNKKAVAAMGGARSANRINSMIPRFAAGGMVDPRGPGTGVVNSAIADVVGAWSTKYNAAINYGYDPGGGHLSPGHNITGTATDTGPAAGWGPGPTQLFETGLRAISNSVDQILYGSHGIGTPYPNHGWGNHAHIEWGMHPDVQAALKTKIKRPVIKGPAGPLLSLGQAAIDRVHKAAQEYLGRKAGSSLGADVGSQGAYKGPLDRIFPHPTTLSNPGIALSTTQVRSLMSKAGLPDWMLGIAQRESAGLHPGIVGDDAAAGFGNTFGYGLWQITSDAAGTGPPNGDIIQRLGGKVEMFNPWHNAQAAKMILDRQGPGAWSATLQNGGIIQKLAQGGTAGIRSNVNTGWLKGGGWGLADNVRNHLKTLKGARTLLDAQISESVVRDAFATSELGSELGPTEKAWEISQNDQLLANLQEQVKWINKGLKTPGLKPAIRTRLKTDLDTLQGITGTGGDILTVKQTLDDLHASSSTSTATDNSAEALAQLRQALMEANLRTAVSQSQYGVLAGSPYGAQQGMVVPAPNVNVNINGQGGVLEKLIRVEVQKETRRQSRSTGAPGSRMAGL